MMLRAVLAVLAAWLALASPPLADASWPMGGRRRLQRLRCDGADAGTESCTTRVTVVGAGIAGLTSARALQDLWHSTDSSLASASDVEPIEGRGVLNVTVIEARATVGGRIYTERSAGSGPMEGDELGAMWIRDSDGSNADNPIVQIAQLWNQSNGLELVDVDLLDINTHRSKSDGTLGLRACSAADPSSVPCDPIDEGASTIDYTASRRCIHMLLEAAQNSLDSSSSGNGHAASLQDAIDVVKAFANNLQTRGDRLRVEDEVGTVRECALATGEFAAVLEHHIAADVEHSFGANTAQLDAKWYNYRMFDGARFPPLFNSIDARIAGLDHPESRGGYGSSTDRAPTHNQNPGSSDHSYTNTQKLIKHGFDRIVNSIVEGDVKLSYNFTDPQWHFASADDPQAISIEVNSPVTKITRICVEQGPSGCVATEYVLELESGFSSRADVVIMAVPLGVLQQRSIEFLDASLCSDWESPSCTPPLLRDLMPATKRESIAEVGFGNINKVLLHYDASSILPDGWEPDDQAVRVYGLARPGDYARGFLTRWFDITSVMGHPALVGYATGLAADVMETAPTATVMNAVNQTLRRIFGGYATPSREEITKWGSNTWRLANGDQPGRYTQGAMPYWKPDNTFTMWNDVAAPIDNSLFFTGDYVVGCTNFPGYRDRDGDTCATYDEEHYCTPMGTWGVRGTSKLMRGRSELDERDYAVGGVSPFQACCACGGGIQEFGSMTSALGTAHGALMAGRNTALDVLQARDQVVMPTGGVAARTSSRDGGNRPLYDCEDDTGEVLSGWQWSDSNVSGSCDWFRANPWACEAGAKLLAISPEETDRSNYEDVNSPDFSGRGPRVACPVACGTCRPRACDAFPCKSGSTCQDKETPSSGIVDETDYECECGLSGYTGKNCDVDYRECDEEPCRDEQDLSNSICYDSHTNLQNRVLEPPDGPCVPEEYPYPLNHSCHLYVPVGHYKCECRMDYGVEKEAMELKNGYRGDACRACDWTMYHCNYTIVYMIAGGLSVVAVCAACYKQSGKSS